MAFLHRAGFVGSIHPAPPRVRPAPYAVQKYASATELPADDTDDEEAVAVDAGDTDVRNDDSFVIRWTEIVGNKKYIAANHKKHYELVKANLEKLQDTPLALRYWEHRLRDQSQEETESGADREDRLRYSRDYFEAIVQQAMLTEPVMHPGTSVVVLPLTDDLDELIDDIVNSLHETWGKALNEVSPAKKELRAAVRDRHKHRLQRREFIQEAWRRTHLQPETTDDDQRMQSQPEKMFDFKAIRKEPEKMFDFKAIRKALLGSQK